MKLFVSYAVYLRLTILSMLIALAACQVNPLKTAETTEQKADALYGQYVLAKEAGASVLQDANVPDSVKRPLAEAMVASKEIGDAGQDLLNAYSAVRADYVTGGADADKLKIAAANIERWLLQATPAITKLVTAVRGARQ